MWADLNIPIVGEPSAGSSAAQANEERRLTAILHSASERERWMLCIH